MTNSGRPHPLSQPFVARKEQEIIITTSLPRIDMYDMEAEPKRTFHVPRKAVLALAILAVVVVGTVGALSFQTVSNPTSFGFSVSCGGHKICLQQSSLTTSGNTSSLEFGLRILSPSFTYNNYFNTSVVNVPQGINMTLTSLNSTITSTPQPWGLSWLSGPFNTSPNTV